LDAPVTDVAGAGSQQHQWPKRETHLCFYWMRELQVLLALGVPATQGDVFK
jgi:hypothetical protein